MVRHSAKIVIIGGGDVAAGTALHVQQRVDFLRVLAAVRGWDPGPAVEVVVCNLPLREGSQGFARAEGAVWDAGIAAQPGLMQWARAAGVQGALPSSTPMRSATSETDLEGANVVIYTQGATVESAGVKTREELLPINTAIARQVAGIISKHAPNALMITVVNPTNAVTHAFVEASGASPTRVCGAGLGLDTDRYAWLLADALRDHGVSVHDVETLVVGGHDGDHMVFLDSLTTIRGEPLSAWQADGRLSPEVRAEVERRTRIIGFTIIKRRKKGAYLSPGASLARMATAQVFDTGEIIPCTVWNEAYQCPLGLPVRFSSQGMEPLSLESLGAAEWEIAAWNASAEAQQRLFAPTKG